MIKCNLLYGVAVVLGTLVVVSCSNNSSQKWFYDEDYIQIDDNMPPAGNSEQPCGIPNEALAEDVSQPDHVIGDGTPESCTSQTVIETIALGGRIVFNCGPDPMTIQLQDTIKIYNDTGPEIVIDGGGKIALSGMNRRRILYMNTCDPNLVWTTPHCNNQDHPRLTLQNLTFIDGNSEAETQYDGGGAVWVRGGRLKVVNCRFFGGACAPVGPDVGGAALRVFDQFEDLPVWVVHSTFGGRENLGGVCSNGGGVSSIGVSWNIYNSVFSYNKAIGNGGNPAAEGTPGGGSGGAIYNDGNTMTLHLCGTRIEHNEVNAYGAAIFFVSNNHDGIIMIEKSIIRNNINHSGHPWQILPGISGHLDTQVIVDEDSIIE